MYQKDLEKMEALASAGEWRTLRSYGNDFINRFESNGPPKIQNGINLNPSTRKTDQKIEYLSADGWNWNEAAFMYLHDKHYDAYVEWVFSKGGSNG